MFSVATARRVIPAAQRGSALPTSPQSKIRGQVAPQPLVLSQTLALRSRQPEHLSHACGEGGEVRYMMSTCTQLLPHSSDQREGAKAVSSVAKYGTPEISQGANKKAERLRLQGGCPLVTSSAHGECTMILVRLVLYVVYTCSETEQYVVS